MVYLYGMGVVSIAISGLVSQILSVIVGAWYMILFFIKNNVSIISDIDKSDIFVLSKYKRFFTININIFIRSICLLLSINSFMILSSYMGNNELAANALLVEFSVFLAYFMDAIANATETIVAEYYINDKVMFVYSLKITLAYTFILGVIFSSLYYIFYPFILGLLTSISEVRDVADKYIIFSILFPTIAAISYWLDGVYVGMLDTITMRNAMIISMLLYFITVYLLWRFGNYGLWGAFLCFFIFRALTLAFTLRNTVKESSII